MPSCGKPFAALACAAVVAALVPSYAHAQGAKAEYERTLGREEVVRRDLDAGTGVSTPLLRRVRALISEYERVARRHPRSGYSDNALYQAAVLSTDAFAQSRDDDDRRAALRLFKALGDRYPSSSLNRQTDVYTRRLETVPRPAAAPAPVATSGPIDNRPLLKAIKREALPGALRITLELEQEAAFRDERIDGPPRVFVDLQNTRTVDSLRDATLGFTDDVVRQIRVGRQLGATRVVLDLHEAARHSVYALYNPYRVVIDFERPNPVLTAAEPPPPVATPVVPVRPAADTKAADNEPGASWVPESTETPAPAPAAPATNTKGGFSLSRQLGLGISRVVIDAGHGGHDPGARVKGLNEADVTLDVALRLEKLLLKVQGVEVVMTRRTNVYIPLEGRTAIANRAGADLFLSIHVNASHNTRARGIETYFLNFAPSPEAEAIAARENAGSAKTMHNLPDIVKAIALNNKLDESRDFASLVQTAMFDRLRKANRDARNLGVKQAPFMVLIGATMPSVLAEISFLTNRQEASLLKTATYRQAIADALFTGISKYQKALKSAQSVAAQ
jgi:N-acetylmuramoyl-L-alanine amidase